MSSPSGLEICLFEGNLGKATVATKNFDVGDLLLSDEPLFSVQAAAEDTPLHLTLKKVLADALKKLEEKLEGVMVPVELQVNIIVAYSMLDDEARGLIKTNFATPSIDKNDLVVQILSTLATAAHEQVSDLRQYSMEELRHVLLVMATNAHEFVDDGKVWVGLYDKGSKLAHSCSPKTLYVGHGRTLKHYALQPIKPGDLVTTNYTISDDIRSCWPTHLRQEQLLRTKFFLCQCERCQSPDDCRIMLCPTCKTPTALRHPGTSSAENPWKCTDCEGTFADSDMPLQTESQLETAVISATSIFDAHDAAQYQPAFLKMDIIRRTAVDRLGPSHWIPNWVKGFLCVSASFRGDVAEAGQLAMEWLEWSAAHVRPYFPHIHARHIASIARHCVKVGMGKRVYEMYREIVPWLKVEFLGNEEVVERLRACAAPYEKEVKQPMNMDDWLPVGMVKKGDVAQDRKQGAKGKGKKKGRR